MLISILRAIGIIKSTAASVYSAIDRGHTLESRIDPSTIELTSCIDTSVLLTSQLRSENGSL